MRFFLMIAWLAACAGCSMGHRDYILRDGNYMVFEHAFTDAAADSARRNAERHCGETRLVAVRTRSTCTLTTCTTDYQCMDRDDADRFAPPDVRKK